jgi:hypothetical protein
MSMLTRKPIVFTVLTLSPEEVRTFLAAEVGPPVKRGDLEQLSEGAIVAIIDGELNEESAISIDEIRRLCGAG